MTAYFSNRHDVLLQVSWLLTRTTRFLPLLPRGDTSENWRVKPLTILLFLDIYKGVRLYNMV